jgi:KaiC/GvpD/RAD55 family RecA-like ATPase
MDRISSGIKGLDDLICGGFPKNDIILLSGTCGTGKTVFSLEFICHNADKEPGIYISFGEELDKIRENAKSIGIDIQKLENSDRIRLLKYDPYKIEDIFEVIENNIREMRAKRVVIDSVSSLGLYIKDISEIRRMVLHISYMLRKNSCTSILISETSPEKNQLSRFEVEEFATDGVIQLKNFIDSGEVKKGLIIWKIRASNHSNKVHPYKITPKGFEIYSKGMVIK